MRNIDKQFLGKWTDKVRDEVISFEILTTTPESGEIVGILNGKVLRGEWSTSDKEDENGSPINIIDIFNIENKEMPRYIYRFNTDGNTLYLLDMNQALYCTLHRL